MLDRGERNAWFESPEIVIEAVVGVLALYIFVVHIFTARAPFIQPGLFLNWNYSLGLFLAFMFGMLNFAPMVLFPTLLQDLRGYPDSIIGLLLATRGAGNMLSFILVVRIANWDPRVALAIGFLCQAVSGWAISQFDINLTFFGVAWTSALQGFGIGMTWVPLTLIMFSTIKPSQLDEASAVFHMLRNFASSVFISICVAIVVRSTFINSAEIGVFLSAYNKVLLFPWSTGSLDLGEPGQLALAGSEVRRQAAMIGYINAFKLFTLLSLIPLPLIWLARLPGRRTAGAQ